MRTFWDKLLSNPLRYLFIGVLILLLSCGYYITGATAQHENSVSLSNFAQGLLLSLIASLIATFFGLIFAEHFDRERQMLSLARDFTRKPQNIDGKWRLRDWRHDRSKEPSDVEAGTLEWYQEKKRLEDACEKKDRSWRFSNDVTLIQTGDAVEGSFQHYDGPEGKTNNGNPRRLVIYTMTGRVVGNIFIGEWKEANPEKAVYWFGSFHFVIDEGDRNTGSSMLGRWTGTSSNGKDIKCGVWEMVQKTKSIKEAPWPSGIREDQ